jgi:archaellum component FlaC
MTFSDDDKEFLIATIGDIVNGATTMLRRDIGLLHEGQTELRQGFNSIKRDVGELKQDVGELKQDVGELKQDVGELKQDVKDIRHHVAALSHEAMLARDREMKDQKATEERLRAIEAIEADVSELKARSDTKTP